MSAFIAGSPTAAPDRVVCHCYKVSAGQICEAIDQGAASTVEDIKEKTCAGTGCTACLCKIRRLIGGQQRGSSSA